MKHAAPVRIEATCLGVTGRAGAAWPEIAPLPAGMRHELETLARRPMDRSHEWADRLAAGPQHATLVKAVRQVLESDFDHIRQLARVTPSA